MKCPFCAEEIQSDAKKCKHCGEWLSVEGASEVTPAKVADAQQKIKVIFWSWAIAAILAYNGCVYVENLGDKNSSEETPVSIEGGGRLRVTRAELGEAWPLIADEAYVGCDFGSGLYVAPTKSSKERWALNGIALQNGIRDLDESNLWKADPKMPPEMKLKISISALQEKARSTCESKP